MSSYTRKYEQINGSGTKFMGTSMLSTVHEDKESENSTLPVLPAALPTITPAKCRDIATLFPIPPAPKLSKIAEPKPMNRIIPGYDMRTLRKQVDEMHEDIQKRVDLHTQLYQQNVVLWKYVQDLLRCNKNNGETMKSYIKTLHQQLNEGQLERAFITDKLFESQSSREAIKTIEEEQKLLEEQIEEMKNVHTAAVDSHGKKEEENETLNTVLEGQIYHLQMVHKQLEDLRFRQLEDAAMATAEEYFASSKKVLRWCWIRVRSRIAYAQRLRQWKQWLRRWAETLCIKYAYGQWHVFFQIARRIRKSHRSRSVKSARLCLAKWKVYTALEKFYQRTARRRRLSSCIAQWKSVWITSQQREKADTLRLSLERRKTLRQVFYDWQRSVVFLEWNTNDLRHKSLRAQAHYLSRLLHQWHRVAKAEHAACVVRASQAARHSLIRWPWKLWRGVFQAVTGVKIMRLQRGFRRLLSFPTYKRAQHKYHVFAKMHATPLRKRYLLARWRRWSLSRQRRRFSTRERLTDGPDANFDTRSSHSLYYIRKSHSQEKVPAVRSPLLYLERRGLFKAVLRWAHRAVQLRLFLAGMKMAARHCKYSLLQNGFTRLYRRTCLRARSRASRQMNTKRSLFHHWVAVYLPFVIREKHIHAEVDRLAAQANHQKQVELLRRWAVRTRKRRRLHQSAASTQRRFRIRLLRSLYNTWKSEWARRLMWQEREGKLDAQRSFVLVELKVKELEDCVSTKEQLASDLEDAQTTLSNMQAASATQNAVLHTQQERLEELTHLVHRLEEEVSSGQKALEDVQKERERLKHIEDLWEAEQASESDRQKALEAEAIRTLRSWEDNTRKLREDAEQARQMIGNTQEEISQSISQDEARLAETLHVTTALHSQVTQSHNAMVATEKENQDIMQSLARVQAKIQLVSNGVLTPNENLNVPMDSLDIDMRKEGITLGSAEVCGEMEAELRRKESEVQSLRWATGQSEARVASLREAVHARKMEIDRANALDTAHRNTTDAKGMSLLAQVHASYQQEPVQPFPPAPHAQAQYHFNSYNFPSPIAGSGEGRGSENKNESFYTKTTSIDSCSGPDATLLLPGRTRMSSRLAGSSPVSASKSTPASKKNLSDSNGNSNGNINGNRHSYSQSHSLPQQRSLRLSHLDGLVDSPVSRKLLQSQQSLVDYSSPQSQGSLTSSSPSTGDSKSGSEGEENSPGMKGCEDISRAVRNMSRRIQSRLEE